MILCYDLSHLSLNIFQWPSLFALIHILTPAQLLCGTKTRPSNCSYWASGRLVHHKTQNYPKCIQADALKWTKCTKPNHNNHGNASLPGTRGWEWLRDGNNCKRLWTCQLARIITLLLQSHLTTWKLASSSSHNLKTVIGSTPVQKWNVNFCFL